MRYVLLGAFLCATIVLPAASLDYLASGQVELVSDADGENLRGGDCDRSAAGDRSPRSGVRPPGFDGD